MRDNETSVWDAIAEAAGFGGTLTILGLGEDETWSYSKLVERAAGGAVSLHQAGVEPGDAVGIVARTSFNFVSACLSIWRAGGAVIPLPLAPRFMPRKTWIEQVEARLVAAGPKALLVEDDDPRLSLDVNHISLSALQSSRDPEFEGPRGSDVALIQFTSGSTAAPRGIVLKHAALVSQFESLRLRLRGDDPSRDRGFFWLPMYHDLGFIASLLRSMSYGIPITLMAPELFISDPGRWLEGMSQTQATVSAAPNFAFGLAARHLEAAQERDLDLSSVAFVANGGEAADPATIERFLGAVEPYGFNAGALLPGYGLAEATCVLTVPPLGHGCRIDSVDRQALSLGHASPAEPGGSAVASFACVGPALEGSEIRIVDPQGCVLGDRDVGEVEARGPSLMEGYLGDPDATERQFRQGWLRTGDLGYLVDGGLYVTGRAKDLLIFRGQNYYAEDLERVAQEVPGVRRGSCVAISVQKAGSESLVLAAETKLTSTDELESCRKAIVTSIWTQTGLSAREVILLPPSSLPKTSSGKLQRGLARELYESGVASQVALVNGSP